MFFSPCVMFAISYFVYSINMGYIYYILDMVIIRSSLGAQLMKNPPAMPESLVQVLSQDDPLEKG